MSQHKLLNVAEIERILADIESDPGRPDAGSRILSTWRSICHIKFAVTKDKLMQRYRATNALVELARQNARAKAT